MFVRFQCSSITVWAQGLYSPEPRVEYYALELSSECQSTRMRAVYLKPTYHKPK